MGLGSGIRDPEKPIPDPGSRAPAPGSGSATLLFLRKDFEDYADLLEADEGEEEYAHQGQRLAQAGRDQRCVPNVSNPIRQ
jgi:hypothetical protein